MIVDLFTYAGDKRMELQCRLFELEGLIDRHIAVVADDQDPTELHRYRGRYPLDAVHMRELRETWKAFDSKTSFVIGEVTEIPSRSVLASFSFTKPAVIKMNALMYSVHYQRERQVFGTVMGVKKHLNKGMRASLEKRRSYEAIEDGGWRLEYFGGEVSLQEQLRQDPVEAVRKAARAISEKYPREHISPMGELLWPYTGPLPEWHAKGHAPNSWDLEW